MQWNKGSVGTHLGFLFTILQWEHFLVILFAFPAVCCWIEPVGGHPKCTYSNDHRPQWAGSGSQYFPTPDWKTGILKTGTKAWPWTTLLSVLVSDVLGVFFQFKSLSVVKFKDYLNRRMNFFPMTLCLLTSMQWEFRAPVSCRLASWAFCSKLWLLLL